MNIVLTEGDIRNMVAEAVKEVADEINEAIDAYKRDFNKNINESLDAINDEVELFLKSAVNGNHTFTVSLSELRAAKYKLDFLWEKLGEQCGAMKRNGTIMVPRSSTNRIRDIEAAIGQPLREFEGTYYI